MEQVDAIRLNDGRCRFVQMRNIEMEAVHGMIRQLESRGFTLGEGYVLCSVSGNLRISEIVDEPNFVVSVVLPE
jgi:formamidase